MSDGYVRATKGGKFKGRGAETATLLWTRPHAFLCVQRIFSVGFPDNVQRIGQSACRVMDMQIIHTVLDKALAAWSLYGRLVESLLSRHEQVGSHVTFVTSTVIAYTSAGDASA